MKLYWHLFFFAFSPFRVHEKMKFQLPLQGNRCVRFNSVSTSHCETQGVGVSSCVRVRSETEYEIVIRGKCGVFTLRDEKFGGSNSWERGVREMGKDVVVARES